MKEILLATSNSGKIAELQAMLAPLHCLTQSSLGIESPEEIGLSFVENAILKARHASRFSHRPALADDSGLVVPALKGEPGIYSSRYAGQAANDADNMVLLLQNMATLQAHQRQAYFYCAIALVQHADDPTPLIATGQWHGVISTTPTGTHGFGYDPIFYLSDHACTAAQLPADIKNKLSHRAKALQALQVQLPCLLQDNVPEISGRDRS